MDTTMTPFVSAVASLAREKAINAALDAGKPLPTEAELQKVGDDANFHATYGFDAKRDGAGRPIQRGIGSPGNETLNHFNSIRRYQGEAKYLAAVRKMWKENPARAREIGLEEPPRAGA